MADQIEKGKRSRGIYLLPNLFTTAALFSGFYAVLASMDGKFELAAIAIFIAMLLDGLDGRVARMTNTQTASSAENSTLSVWSRIRQSFRYGGFWFGPCTCELCVVS